MTVFFYWADEGETTFDAETMCVEDEAVLSFDVSQSEGEAAQLTVEIINPRTGLLNPTRSLWAWLSYDDGDTVTPLFFGRLVGIPQNLEGETIALAFVARSADFETQKAALADTLRVAPYYDPLFISAEGRLSPDSVLEARPALWHVDRVTHEVTISDVLDGEEGNIDLGETHYYDSLKVSYSQPPARRCVVEAEAVWLQKVAGTIDISPAFPPLETLTAQGLVASWPKVGDTFGPWTIVETDPGVGRSLSAPFGFRTGLYKTLTGDLVTFARRRLTPRMVLQYGAERTYAEKMTFEMAAGVQAMQTEESASDTLTVQVSAAADALVDPMGAPVVPPGAYSFFKTERGHQAMAYLLMLARARLLARSRAVEITLEMPFATGLALSLRKTLTVQDARIPGGVATGKVKSYSLRLNGDDGAFSASAVIGCAVGTNTDFEPSTGTETYAADYSDGYTLRAGAHLTALAGSVYFEDYAAAPINDDGIRFENLRPADVVQTVNYIFPAEEQEAEVRSGEGLTLRSYFQRNFYGAKEVIDRANEVFTEVELVMRPIENQRFETTISATVGELQVPNNIDLTAV